MSVLGDLLSGRLRTEMRQRVDEILKCGNQWDQTARGLIEALNRLTDSIQKGNLDPSGVKPIAQGTRKLAKETRSLTQAFKSYQTILEKMLTRFG